MTDHENFITVAILLIVVIVTFFMFGFMFGREHQCNTLDAEYVKGKCVKVTRTEVKP